MRRNEQHAEPRTGGENFHRHAMPAPALLPRAIATRHSVGMATLLLLTPLFLVFEVWQLVVSERFLGIKQIARNADPRTLGLGELRAFFWSATILAYWLWMLLLLATKIGRLHGLGLLAVTVVGYSLRRGSSLKWVLVVLTFEGAVRVGLLASLCGLIWREL